MGSAVGKCSGKQAQGNDDPGSDDAAEDGGMSGLRVIKRIKR